MGKVRLNIPVRNSKGFTLIELILVVAIISLLAAASSPFLIRFTAQNNLDDAGDKVVSAIRKAQGYAMGGKNGVIWGVCMSGSDLRLFSGSCASPTFAEDYDLFGVNVSGVSETTFSGLSGRRGEPSNTLSISVSNDIGSVSITLNSAGGMEIY